MGKRGPAPHPTKLKVLHGERRPARINRNEPQPRSVLPTHSDGMSEASRKVWDRVMREFGDTGVITAADTDALRAYCEAVVRYEHAAQMLEESGPLVRGARRGELVKNPLHQVVRDNADLMRQYARELGLTPSARSGLNLPQRSQEEDPLAAWEAGG